MKVKIKWYTWLWAIPVFTTFVIAITPWLWKKELLDLINLAKKQPWRKE